MGKKNKQNRAPEIELVAPATTEDVVDVTTDEVEATEVNVSVDTDETPEGQDDVTDEVKLEITDAPEPGAQGPRKIKDVMYECIVVEKITDTDEVLKRIYTEFPEANSGPKDVSWYRWKFRKAGHEVAGGRSKGSMTEEEKKAKKSAYEAEHRRKQQEKKDALRAEAEEKRMQEQQARLAEAVDRALEIIAERELPTSELQNVVKEVLAEMQAA